MNQHTTLSILQYNVRKSRDIVMATLLRDPRIHEYDILAVQEPWRNPYTATTHHPAKDVFHLCYPAAEGEEGPARVCFFVNKKIDHSRWRFREHSKDVCSLVIKLSADHQDQQKVAVHNIYNAGGVGSPIPRTLTDIRAVLEEHSSDEQILLGDFNLHHPLWGGQAVRYADPQAEDLIAIIEDFDLSSTLAPGTITYEEAARQTTIDLCLVTVGLVDRVIRSQVDRELDHDSDHLPISTVLDMTVQHLQNTAKRNWKRMNEATYLKILKQTLPPLRRPMTKTALDNYVREVVIAVSAGLDKAVPQIRASSQAREV
jgi:exonuclease III